VTENKAFRFVAFLHMFN